MENCNCSRLSHIPDVGPSQTLFTGQSWSGNKSRHKSKSHNQHSLPQPIIT